MIDLHCHMLPAIDDGAFDMAESLQMARLAVDDGIEQVACTPHIYPGLYDNTAEDIQSALVKLRHALKEADIPLSLTIGADTHMAPDMLDRIRQGSIPTLHGTRYFLLEPPHHIAPKGFEQFVINVITAGYVPIITHPERLGWIKRHYRSFVNVARQGAWMQITASSYTGHFGKQAKYWAERFLDDGLVHILATDAHGRKRRVPCLTGGRQVAERYLGCDEARRLVIDRPMAVLADCPPDDVIPPPGLDPTENRPRNRRGLLRRLFDSLA